MIAKRESHSDLRQCTLLKLNAREEETVLISESVCMMRRTSLTSALDMPEIMSYV